MSAPGDARFFLREQSASELVLWPDLGRVYVDTQRSPAKESCNEDGALVLRIDETRAVVALADGAGGHRSGDVASREALAALADAFSDAAGATSEELAGCALAGFEAAQQRVRAAAAGAATTLLALVVHERSCRLFHAGDSKALVIGGGGSLRFETISHSPVGYGVEAGFIAREEAVGHADLHFVSNLIGVEGMHVGVSSPMELRERDRVVLASDGLFDNLPVEDVVDALRRGRSAESVPGLRDRCREAMLQGGHPDDLTLLVFRPAS